jgi:lipopolysaccharide export system permease protein
VIKADSGRMYTILNERYLKFELYNGYNYREGVNEDLKLAGKKNQSQSQENITRSHFNKTQIVFDLSSYDFQRTDKKWFQGHRIMRNMNELEYDIDSMQRDVLQQRLNYYHYRQAYFNFLYKTDSADMPEDVHIFKLWKDSVERSKYLSMRRNDSLPSQNTALQQRSKDFTERRQYLKNKFSGKVRERKKNLASAKAGRGASGRTITDTTLVAKIDSVYNMPDNRDVVQAVTNMARQIKANVSQTNTSVEYSQREMRIFIIQWHKILASSLACIAMFLIGAPLGSIIKKGGLGVPFLVSILFFIIYYLLSMQGEKLAKQGVVDEWIGVWAADFILLVVGMVFLRQARLDARIFDSDAYRVFVEKALRRFRKRAVVTTSPTS